MRRFVLATLVMSISLAGCDKEKAERYSAPTLDGITHLSIVSGMSYSIPIGGGSGEYTAEFYNPADPVIFAGISIERDGESDRLAIETAEGETGWVSIVVTDVQSGKTAVCNLAVCSPKNSAGWKITGLQNHVDAVYPSEIIADLQSKSFPVESSLYFSAFDESGKPGYHAVGYWHLIESDEQGFVTDTLATGTFVSAVLDLKKLPETYDNLPFEQDVRNAVRYVFEQEDGRHVYDLFHVSTPGSNGATLDRVFYEDRTAYYRTEYPYAQVRRVVNRYVSDFGHN